MWPLFFIHPPKSGGSSVLSFFEINSGKGAFTRFIWDTPGWPNRLEQLDRTKLGGGHQGYGFHRLARTPLDYLVILRDPLKRQISHYWYAMTGKNGDIEERASISHAEALARSGVISLDEWVRESHDGRNIFIKMITGHEVVDDDSLRLACEHIERRFIWAGCCEDLSQFLLFLCGKSNLDLPFYSKTNVTKKDCKSNPDISKDAVNRFMADNVLDYKLYEFVKARVEREVEKGGAAYREAIALVRRIQAKIDSLDNPHRFTSSEHGFNSAYLQQVRKLIRSFDVSAINSFLARARAERVELTEFFDGVVDVVEGDFVGGWAINLADPDREVPLEIHVDGNVVASGVTGLERRDVTEAGYKSARTGFAIKLPPSAQNAFTIRIGGSVETIRNGGKWARGWYRT